MKKTLLLLSKDAFSILLSVFIAKSLKQYEEIDGVLDSIRQLSAFIPAEDVDLLLRQSDQFDQRTTAKHWTETGIRSNNKGVRRRTSKTAVS